MDTNLSFEACLVLSVPLDSLPPSALVDIIHLAAGLKQIVRTRLLSPEAFGKVASWCLRFGLVSTCDEDGYVFIGNDLGLVRQAMTLDLSPHPHEIPLGILLGYPLCCCQAIASVGESGIEAYKEIVASWDFSNEYDLINPLGYTRGQSLICHLPCSAKCNLSLIIAKRASSFLRNNSLLETVTGRYLQILERNRGDPLLTCNQ